MRPIELTMEAFGPYEKKTVVDFTALGDRSFFLIHGATGAGKTTILDAICYAFYGSASAAGRDSSMLRSRQAGLDSDTYVQFRFALGEKIYEIFRNPDYTRQSKRGTGTAQAKNGAELWQIMGEERKSLAAGTKNVTQKMTALLGFASDEFRQVVLLPQGEFRRLLMADSAERQGIMERLFKTERFRKIEEMLKSQAKDSVARQQEISRERDILLQDTGAASLPDFEQGTAAKRAALAAACAVTQSKQAVRDAAQQAEKEGQRVAGLFAALQAAETEQKDCEAKLESVQQYQSRLVLADQAAALQDVQVQAVQARQTGKEKEAAKAAALAQEAVCRQQLAAAQLLQGKEQAQAEKREALKQSLQQLHTYEAAAAEAEAAEEQLKACTVKEQTVKARAEKAALAQAELLRQQESLQQQAAAQAEKAAHAGEYDLQVEKLLQQQQAGQRLLQDEAERKAAEQAAEAARQAAQKAQTAYQEESRDLAGLQHLFAEGQAALLARDLVPGMACPVCGATEHPLLAASEAVIPDEARIKKAQQAQQAADRARQAAERAESQAERRLAEVCSQMEADRLALGDAPLAPEVLTVRLAALQAESRAAKDALAAQTKLAEELSALQRAQVQGEKEAAQLAEDVQTAQAETARLRGVLETRRQQLPKDYREPQALRTAIRQTTVQSETMENAWQQAEKQLHAAEQAFAAQQAAAQAAVKAAADGQQQAARAAALFQERLETAGFAAVQDYEAALAGKFATAEGREEVRRHLRSFEDRHTAAKAAWKKAVLETGGQTRPNLAVLTEKLQAAMEAWKESYAAEQALQTEIGQREQKAKRLQKLADEEAALEDVYRTVGRLAEVANGTNAYNMHFQTYVLRSLLNDVVDAANARLLVMSRGQYRLQPKKDIADHRRSAGLDLDVFDEYTGYERPMATLSGGESFLASLSLALGLADVVTSYAGGTRLDTIFIDEGFGTLDTETLDLAIRALLDLQKGGRLVGIISHVEELKERIDARLEVTKGKNGSEARFIVG